MTDKQRAVISAMSPVISAVLFAFFLYASREFIASVRADNLYHTQQIRELEQQVREKSLQLQFIESQMHEMKDVLRRIEEKIDEIKR